MTKGNGTQAEQQSLPPTREAIIEQGMRIQQETAAERDSLRREVEQAALRHRRLQGHHRGADGPAGAGRQPGREHDGGARRRRAPAGRGGDRAGVACWRWAAPSASNPNLSSQGQAMTRMGWLISIVVLSGISAAISADAGPLSAGACSSYREAKALHRGAYLHWRRGTHGRRCWGVKERKGNVQIVQNVQIVRSDEKQQPKNEPPLFVEPWNLLDHPSWAWVRLARFDRVEGRDPPVEEVGFSTFLPGQEPDVWPALEKETAAPLGGAAAGGAILAVLVVLGWRFRHRLDQSMAAAVRR